MTILVARIGAFRSAIVFFGCADYLIPTHKAQSAAAHAEREQDERARSELALCGRFSYAFGAVLIQFLGP
jgi:hypothetical protein